MAEVSRKLFDLALRDNLGSSACTELVDGDPGILVRIQSVAYGATGVAQRIQIIDEGDPAVLEGELRDLEHVA